MANEMMICICGRGYTADEESDRCPRCGRCGLEKCLPMGTAEPIDDETLWGDPQVEKMDKEFEYASASGTF